ncbi:alpha/beta hydrolase [Nocardia transvalensis]|uniref:alpha/beta hydrolase n=1 Tax=Nocardia transvalensis TaxID=37333 RepID=UPI003A5D1003
MTWRRLEDVLQGELMPVQGTRKLSAHEMIAAGLEYLKGKATVVVVDELKGPVDEHGVGSHAYVMYWDETRNAVMVDDPRLGPPREFDPNDLPDVKATWGVFFGADGESLRPPTHARGADDPDLPADGPGRDRTRPSPIGDDTHTPDPTPEHDPLSQAQRFLDESPELRDTDGVARPLTDTERVYAHALADALGLRDSLAGLPDPLHAIADLTQQAWVRNFLDTSPDGAGRPMRFPDDFGPLDAEELQRAGWQPDGRTPTELPRADRDAIGEWNRPTQPSGEPRPMSAADVRDLLARQLGLNHDALTPERLAETIADQRHRTLLRAGAVEALETAVRDHDATTDPAHRNQLAAVRDTFAHLLGVSDADLAPGRFADTIGRLRAETLARAVAVGDLADVTQVARQDSLRPAAVQPGDSRRFDIEIDGQRVPVQLVADVDGNWRVVPAQRMPAPHPAPRPAPPAQQSPETKWKRFWRRLKAPFTRHDMGIQYPLGSERNADYYQSVADSATHAVTGHDAGVHWDPAFFTLQALKLWKGRGQFISWLRGDTGVDPGQPRPPELPAAQERPGVESDVVPPVPDREIIDPNSAQRQELSDAIAERHRQGVALYQAADDLGLPLPDLSPEAVRRATAELQYRVVRHAAMVEGLRDAALRYNAEDEHVGYLDMIRQHNPDMIEHFVKEMHAELGHDPDRLDLERRVNVNNNPNLPRRWWQLEYSSDPMVRKLFENALRRDQIRLERGDWARMLGVDPRTLTGADLDTVLNDLHDRGRELGRAAADFERLAHRYSAADTRFGDLADAMARDAGRRWVDDQNGVMLDPDRGIGLVGTEPMRLVVVDGGLNHDRLLADALADPRNADLAEGLTNGGWRIEYRVAWADLTGIHTAQVATPEVRHFSGAVDGRRVSVTMVREGDEPWRVVPDNLPEPTPAEPLDPSTLSPSQIAARVDDAAARLDVPLADLSPDRVAATVDRLRTENALRALRIAALVDYGHNEAAVRRFGDFEDLLSKLDLQRDTLRGRPPAEVIEELRQQHPDRAAHLDKLAKLLSEHPELVDMDPRVPEQAHDNAMGLPVGDPNSPQHAARIAEDYGRLLDALRARASSPVTDVPTPDADWVRMLGVDLESATPQQAEAIYKNFKAGKLADLTARSPEQLTAELRELRAEVDQAAADIDTVETLAEAYYRIPTAFDPVNHCVPESIQHLREQQGDVADPVSLDPRRLSGVAWGDLQANFRGARPEQFVADADSGAHTKLLQALRAQGSGATAWVVDQRTTTDDFGVGAHSYTITHLGMDRFDVDGRVVTYAGTDPQGREWFVTETGYRVSLAELTGGTRAETAATWAIVYHDGRVVEGVGEQTPLPDTLRIGQSTPDPMRPSRDTYEIARPHAPGATADPGRTARVNRLTVGPDGLFYGPDGRPYSTDILGDSFLLGATPGDIRGGPVLHAEVHATYANPEDGPAACGLWVIENGRIQSGVLGSQGYPDTVTDPRFAAQFRYEMHRLGVDLSGVNFDDGTQGRLWARDDAPTVTDVIDGVGSGELSRMFRGHGDDFWVSVTDVHEGFSRVTITLSLHPVRGEPGSVTLELVRSGGGIIAQYSNASLGPDAVRVNAALQEFHSRVVQPWLAESGVGIDLPAVHVPEGPGPEAAQDAEIAPTSLSPSELGTPELDSRPVLHEADLVVGIGTPEDAQAQGRLTEDDHGSWERTSWAPVARRWAVDQMTALGLESRNDSVRLVTSELVANALEHSTGPVRLELRVVGHPGDWTVLIQVVDTNPDHPLLTEGATSVVHRADATDQQTGVDPDSAALSDLDPEALLDAFPDLDADADPEALLAAFHDDDTPQEPLAGEGNRGRGGSIVARESDATGVTALPEGRGKSVWASISGSDPDTHLPADEPPQTAPDPANTRIDPEGVEIADSLGEFHGAARPDTEKALTREMALNAVENSVRALVPAGVGWHRNGHLLLPDGRPVHIHVGEVEGTAIGSFRRSADGTGFDITLSKGLRNRDIPRAAANLLVRIRQATDPDFRHPGVRFAELKVVATQLDEAIFDPNRARLLSEIRQDLGDLLEHLGITDPAGDAAGRLAAWDPELAHRVSPDHLDAFEHRPVFGKDLTDAEFEESAAAHLAQLRDILTGDFADDVVMAEALALNGRMREELCRRMFEPMFADKAANAARKAVVGDEDHHEITNDQFMNELAPLRAAFNDPMPHGSPQRVRALLDAIDQVQHAPGIPLSLRDAIDFDRMREVARTFADIPDRVGGVLDRGTGRIEFPHPLPGHPRGASMSLREFLHGIDRANRGAAAHGFQAEYVVVVHAEADGRSSIDVLTRPRPQYRMPADRNHPVLFEERPSVAAAREGGHTVDVGVGRSGFAVELTPLSDRSGGGLILQTELASDYADAGQRRRVLGILDPGPLTVPGSLMVYADLLFSGEVLNVGDNGGVARFYINNVSAHFGDAEYNALARQLPRALAPGARIEIQWDMKSELREGGTPGDRGHIQGDELMMAINRVLPPSVADAFEIIEHTQFAYPGNKNYVYSIDAGASNVINPAAMAKYSPPQPTDRMVIVYNPAPTASDVAAGRPDVGEQARSSGLPEALGHSAEQGAEPNSGLGRRGEVPPGPAGDGSSGHRAPAQDSDTPAEDCVLRVLRKAAAELGLEVTVPETASLSGRSPAEVEEQFAGGRMRQVASRDDINLRLTDPDDPATAMLVIEEYSIGDMDVAHMSLMAVRDGVVMVSDPNIDDGAWHPYQPGTETPGTRKISAIAFGADRKPLLPSAEHAADPQAHPEPAITHIDDAGDGSLESLFPEPEWHISETVGHDPTVPGEEDNARAVALRALQEFDGNIDDVAIRPGPEPVWPRTVVGSFTRDGDYFAAVVAGSTKMGAVGIDAQRNEPPSEDVLRSAARPEELRWLADMARQGDVHWDRVLVSAKESWLKAWQQLTGDRRATIQDVRLTFSMDEGTFTVEMFPDDPALSRALSFEMSGRFVVAGDRILTAVTVPQVVSIETAPELDLSETFHRGILRYHVALQMQSGVTLPEGTGERLRIVRDNLVENEDNGARWYRWPLDAEVDPAGPALPDIGVPTDPEQLHELWSRLSDAEKDALYAQDPFIGNRDGIPHIDRDRYNRQTLAMLREQAELEGNKERLSIIDDMKSYLDTTEEGRPQPLLSYLDDKLQYIYALGNPDTADYVAVALAGAFRRRSGHGYAVQTLIQMHQAVELYDPTAKTAALLFGAYNNPSSLVAAASSVNAEEGAQKVREFHDGLRVTHQGPPAYTTTIAHSYGAVTGGHSAGHGNELNADALVFIGSFGTGVDSVADLRLTGVDPADNGDHIFATISDYDSVKLIPPNHGPLPTDPAFGATVFESDSTPGPARQGWNPADHTAPNYFYPRKKAWRKLGLILTGQGHRLR